MQYIVTYDVICPHNGPTRRTKKMSGSIDQILTELELAHGSWDEAKRETKRATVHFINTERVVKDMR